MMHVFILVVTQHHSDRFHLTAPDGTADNGAIAIRLHEGGPAAMLNHVAHRLFITAECGPVENAKVYLLVMIQLLLLGLSAVDDLLPIIQRSLRTAL